MSFVLENNGAKLTMEESKGDSTPHLSLVTETAQVPDRSFLPLTHANLLQGSRVRVNQERPITWTVAPARFRTHLQDEAGLTMFGNIR